MKNRIKYRKENRELTIDELPEPPKFDGVLFEDTTNLNYNNLAEPPALKDYIRDISRNSSAFVRKTTKAIESRKSDLRKIMFLIIIVSTIYSLFFSVLPGNEEPFSTVIAADTNDACSPAGEGDGSSGDCDVYGICNGAGWDLSSGDCDGDAACSSYSSCCGDDEKEFTIDKEGGNDAPSEFATNTSEVSCCDVSTDCVYKFSCEAVNTVTGTIPQRAKCWNNVWYGGDNSESACDDIVAASKWISTGTGSGNCCGDDGTGEDFNSASAEGNSACYNGNVRADGWVSGNMLVSNGVLYDCGGQETDDSGLAVHSDPGDCNLREGYYCNDDNTWKTTRPPGCDCTLDSQCTSGQCDNETTIGRDIDAMICFDSTSCTGGSPYCSDHDGCQIDGGGSPECDDYDDSSCLTDAYCDDNCGYGTLTTPTLTDASTNTSKPSNSELGNIRLTWTDNSDGESTFEIYRSTDNSTFTTLATSATSPYFDVDSDDNTLYFYKISAIEGSLACYGSNSTVLHNITADRTGEQTPRFGLVEREVVLYYDFEENSSSTVIDKSSFGNDGVNNGANWSSGSGYVGGGMTFDGGNDYIEVNNRVFAPNTATLVLWFYSENLTEVHHLFYEGESGDGMGGENETYLHTNGASLRFHYYNSTGLDIQINGGTTLNENQWYQAAVVINNGVAELFLNGSSEGTDNYNTIDTTEWLNKARFGRHNGPANAQRAYKGRLDLIKVYDRALTAGEISLMYNQTKGNYTDNKVELSWTDQAVNDSLVLYMPFEENQGSSTRDWSDKKNDGDITGTDWVSGKYGTALNFSGSSHVNVSSGDFSNINTKVTVTLWQYGDPTLQPQADIIFYGKNSSGNRILNSHLPWSDSKVYWDAGGINGGTFDRINCLAENSTIRGDWNFWAFTKDASTGEMKTYVNGYEFCSGSSKTGLMKGITEFYIGSSGLGSYYDGMIDEFRIYNRSLSQREIINVMQSGIIKKGIFRANASDGIYTQVGTINFSDTNYTDTTGDTADPEEPTSLTSSSHSVTTWSSDNTVDFNWNKALDNGNEYYYYVESYDDEGNRDTRMTHYVVNDELAAATLNVVSLVENNKICVDSTCIYLDKGETGTFAAANLEPNSRIVGTGAFSTRSSATETGAMTVPSWWKGKLFAYDANRYIQNISVYAFEDNTLIELYNGTGELKDSITLDRNRAGILTFDFTDATGFVLNSSKPVLAYIDSSTTYDFFPLHPATTEWYGVGSGAMRVTCAEDSTEYDIYESDGTSTLGVTCDKGNSTGYGAAGVQGEPPSQRVIATTGSIGVMAIADGDGGAATTFLPKTELSYVYALPAAASYVAMSTVDQNTTCKLYEGDSLTDTLVATETGGSGYPGHVYFNTSGTFAAGAIISCDGLAHAYAEISNVETNLLGIPTSPKNPNNYPYADDYIRKINITSGLDGYDIACNQTSDDHTGSSKDYEETQTTHTCTFPDGNSNYFHIVSVDIAGNYDDTSADLGPYYIDTAAPSFGQTEIFDSKTYYNGSDYFYNGTIRIRTTFTESDSGLEACDYTDDNGVSWNSGSFNTTHCFSGTFTPSVDITVNFNATDNAGNGDSGTSRVYLRDNTAPSCSVNSITESSEYAYVSGTTVYYNNITTGSFNVIVTSGDPGGTGVHNVTFPALSTLTGDGGDDTSTYQSSDVSAYSWTQESSYDGSASVTCYDVFANSGTDTYTITLDIVAPSGGEVENPHQNITTTSVRVNLSAGTDSESGLGSSQLYRKSALLQGISCGAYGAWSTVGTQNPADTEYDDTVSLGYCYQYLYQVFDNVINEVNYTTTNVTIANSLPTVTSLDILPATAPSDINLDCNATITDAENDTFRVEYWWYDNSVFHSGGNVSDVKNNTNTLISTLSSADTTTNETWNCTIRVFDGMHMSGYSSTTKRILATFLHDPVITPSTPSTNDELLCNFNTTSPVYNITNWFKNDVSDTLLLMPFEGGSNSTYTKDYAPYIKKGIVDGATWTTTSAKHGGAYYFDGNDHICMDENDDDVCDNDALNISGDFTISVWINHTVDTNGFVASSFGQAGGGGYGILLGGGGVVYCRTDSGSGLTDSYTTTGVLPVDEWHHVAVTLSSSSCSIYVDGVDQTNTKGTHNLATSNYSFYVGARGDLGGEAYTGYIDELRIYNRSLSGDEIRDLRDFNYTVLDSDATTLSDDWLCDVTLNDLSADGENKNSSSVTVANSAPFFTDSPIITPETPNDEDTLSCNFNVTDYNGETVYNITNWHKNNISDTILLMPFEGGSTSSHTKDYAPYIQTGEVNGATWTTTNSKVGGAYYFDGNDYICSDQDDDGNCDNYGVLNLSNDFTISAWVNHTVDTNGFVASSFGQGGGGGYGILLGGGGVVYCRTDDGSGNTDSFTGAGALPVDEWHHVAVTLSGSSCKIYVDGVDQTGTANTHTVATSNYSFYIGARGDLGGEYYTGYIDELRIYNRSLSAEEIRDLSDLNYTTLDSAAITEGDEWLCEVTPNDHNSDGTAENSSIVTIASSNDGPQFTGDPIIIPSSPTTLQETACYFNVTDPESDTVYNITNWYKNGVSDTLLLMPFEGGSTSTYTKDYSPYIRTGKVTGATYNSGFGLVGGSYHFDGNDNICTDQNDDGTCDNYGVLNLTGDVTISTWVNHTSGTGWVATSFGSANGGGYGVMVGSDGTVYCRTDDGSGSTDSSTSSGVVSDDTWTHLAITLNGSSCRIFVDGTDQTNSAGSHTIANSDNPFYIGARGDLGGEYFTGHIDEVRIYNRTLGVDEILDLYDLNYTTLDNTATSNNDKWKCEVTLNDGTLDGEAKNSTSITIANIAPVFTDNPVITPSSPISDDTLVCNYNVSDTDNDVVYNITNWYLNNDSITKLLLPFEADGSNNMSDYSGNNNDGSINNLGDDILWKPTGGRIGGGFDFNNGDVIQTNQQPPSQEGTVEMWVYPETYHAILDIAADPGTGGGDFRWYINTGSSNLYGFWIGGEYRVSTSEEPPLNQWTLVTLTWNSSGTYLYFNGTFIDKNTNGPPAFSGSGLDIGGNSGSADQNFNGTIDEVRVYNRSLSQSEIINHFNLKYDQLSGNETNPGEEWMCGVTLADSNEKGGSENSTGVLINSPPTKPTLLIPTNGNITVHDRTPYFDWTSTDVDGDNLNYTINITFSSVLDCGPDISTNASESEYMPTSDYCVDHIMYWRVRAYDGKEYSEWSDEWNFTIESFISLNLTNSGIQFGSMNVLDEKHTDTGGGGYSPLVIENNGNIRVNVTRISANASLFQVVDLNTEYFQFKADDDSTEANSFNFSGSTTTWTNVRNITKQNTSIIEKLNYTDSNDEAEIDIRVQVPLNEPPGHKKVLLYIIGERSIG